MCTLSKDKIYKIIKEVIDANTNDICNAVPELSRRFVHVREIVSMYFLILQQRVSLDPKELKRIYQLDPREIIYVMGIDRRIDTALNTTFHRMLNKFNNGVASIIIEKLNGKDILNYALDFTKMNDCDIESFKSELKSRIDFIEKCIFMGRENDVYNLTKAEFDMDQLQYIFLNLPINYKKDYYRMSSYCKPEFSIKQMEEIKSGLLDNLDVRIYAEPSFTANQMKLIRHALLRGWNPSYFDKKNLKEKIDEFDDGQINEITRGLIYGINVRTYADTKFTATQMCHIVSNMISEIVMKKPRECDEIDFDTFYDYEYGPYGKYRPSFDDYVELYTIKESAILTGLHPNILRNAVNNGKFTKISQRMSMLISNTKIGYTTLRFTMIKLSELVQFAKAFKDGKIYSITEMTEMTEIEPNEAEIEFIEEFRSKLYH